MYTIGFPDVIGSVDEAHTMGSCSSERKRRTGLEDVDDDKDCCMKQEDHQPQLCNVTILHGEKKHEEKEETPSR